MKIALILAGLCALALAAPKYVPKKFHTGDKVFLEKQKLILDIFKYVNQPSYYKEHVAISKSFPIKTEGFYTKPYVVEDFFHYYEHDILPKGEIFSIYYEPHMKQAVSLFKLFYYAKDFDTFYKAAVWARQHVNEGMFVYAFSVAVVHRPDTHGIVLPPIYEVYPQYFFSTEVIHKAQHIKQQYSSTLQQHESEYDGYTVIANYSGWYLNLHPEQSMSYFTEDIGINSYYYYYNLYYPFWMDGEEFQLNKDRRGELYFYVHQQLLARYYLERLSNDFGEIPTFKWDWPVETGYYPSLQYPNGLEFPIRPNHAYVHKHWDYNHPQFSNYTDSYTYVQDYSRRIRDVIDSGYIFTPTGQTISLYDKSGINILGNLIEGNPDSLNSKYYGSLETFARHLLGYSYYPLDKYKVAPSVLEHFETSLRDPAFYQMYKWIMQNLLKYKNKLPYYKPSELEFPGVKIESFEVDRLVTFFEWFYSDISNAVYVNEKEYDTDSFKIRVKQQRLTHKPFTYTINVQSTKPVEAVVKVFIGPKYDEYGRVIDLNENRWNMVFFDKFTYKLQPGKNSIVRNSAQSYYVSDRTTYKQLYKQVLTAIQGNEEFQVQGSETYWGFPNRFLLPKGTTDGQTFQFYTIIIPYHAPTTPTFDETHYPQVGQGGKYVDTLPFGYPFDRWINKETFYVPNGYFKDVVVYHRKYEDINTSTYTSTA